MPRYFITKYVGQIIEEDLEPGSTDSGFLYRRRGWQGFMLGRDCFENLEVAQADAQRRVAKKVASLRKGILKLETTPIKVARLKD